MRIERIGDADAPHRRPDVTVTARAGPRAADRQAPRASTRLWRGSRRRPASTSSRPSTTSGSSRRCRRCSRSPPPTERVRVGPVVPESVHAAPGRDRGPDRGARPGVERPGLPRARGRSLARVPGYRPARPLRPVARRGRSCGGCSRATSAGFEGERFSLPPGARLRYPVRAPRGSASRRDLVAALAALRRPRARRAEGRRQRKPRPRPGDARAGRRRRVGLVFGAVTVVDEDGGRARAWHGERSRCTSPSSAHSTRRCALDPELLAHGGCRSEGEAGAARSSRTTSSGASRSQARRPRSPSRRRRSSTQARARRLRDTARDRRAKGVDLLCRSVLPRLGVA